MNVGTLSIRKNKKLFIKNEGYTLYSFWKLHPKLSNAFLRSPHTWRITTQFLESENIATLQWPSYSPHFNPIGHLWDQLGRSLDTLNPRPTNRDELSAGLIDAWNNIPQERLSHLINIMRRRCRQCIVANGGHTLY